MGKTLDTVIQYASEDVAKISKHWIIFLKRTKKLIIHILIILLLYSWAKNWLYSFSDKINELEPSIPFEIKLYIFPAILIYFVIKVITGFFKTFIEYKTIGLSINNIQIKGKSGLLDVGIVNVPLEQIQNVKVYAPLWGRVFHYGSITISTNNGNIVMTNMTNVEQFQDAIILLQEAQKEGRNIRQAERHEKTIESQTIAQVKAIEAQTIAQVQMLSDISQNINQKLNLKEQPLIESNDAVSEETNE